MWPPWARSAAGVASCAPSCPSACSRRRHMHRAGPKCGTSTANRGCDQQNWKMRGHDALATAAPVAATSAAAAAPPAAAPATAAGTSGSGSSRLICGCISNSKVLAAAVVAHVVVCVRQISHVQQKLCSTEARWHVKGWVSARWWDGQRLQLGGGAAQGEVAPGAQPYLVCWPSTAPESVKSWWTGLQQPWAGGGALRCCPPQGPQAGIQRE